MPTKTTGGTTYGGWNLWSNGRVGQYLRIARKGTYRVVVRAAGSPAEGVWPEMALLVDGRAVATATVSRGEMADYRLQADLTAGDQDLMVILEADSYEDAVQIVLGQVRVQP